MLTPSVLAQLQQYLDEDTEVADIALQLNIKPETVADVDGFSDFFTNSNSDYSHIHHEIDRLLKMFKDETLF